MTVFKGGIICCDAGNNISRYLVENKGRILFIGDRLPEKYRNAPLYDLGSRVLLPSFVDTHLHYSSFAVFYFGLHVSGAESNSAILDLLSEEAGKTRGQIVGFGLSPHAVREGILLTKEDLDRVCPEKPVFIVKYDGHAAVINTALLRTLPKEISGLRGYNPDTGLMTQEAFFRVSDFVTNSISPLQMIDRIIRAYDYMAGKGIGIFHTVSGVGFPGDLDVDLERWLARGIGSGIQTRLFFQTMNTRKVEKRKLPRIGGCFETALDGSFGSVDAALSAPYEGSDSKGVLFYSDEAVADFCKAANRQGLQIEMHAIGDAAFDQAAKGLEAALKDYPRDDHRHGIIHACLPTERGIDICAKYGIQIPVQPAFIDWAQEPSHYLKSILGDREARLNPLRTLWDSGILLSGGSDAPVTLPDPIMGIHKACNHTRSDESLTVEQALKLFTINGYKASFDDLERGSLEEGKIADMVVLSENPVSVKKENLKNLQVDETYYAGKRYKKSGKPGVLSLLQGMISRGPV